MAVYFSGKELLEMAVTIEKNGAEFYDRLARATSNRDVKAVYQELADKERQHIGTFETMLLSRDTADGIECSEEYAPYMQAMVDSIIFTNEQGLMDLARMATGEQEALQIGITAEKDSILFYTEMRDMVRAADRETVNNIVDEEKRHLRELVELRRMLALAA